MKDAVSLPAAAKTIVAIAAFIVASRITVRPLLKVIARHGSREVFTATALLLVIASAVLMERVGVSMSLGAFIAAASSFCTRSSGTGLSWNARMLLRVMIASIVSMLVFHILTHAL
jgi:hypothetical protein